MEVYPNFYKLLVIFKKFNREESKVENQKININEN